MENFTFGDSIATSRSQLQPASWTEAVLTLNSKIEPP